MDRMIYTASTGANAAMQRQALLSNNLANVSTNGFRAELAMFRSVPIEGDGATTRVFTAESSMGHSDRAGYAHRTGRELDAMAKGNAWFAVQGLDGTESYTRNGSMEINPEGTLVNSNGLTMLSDGGAPLVAPAGARVSVGSDGTLTAKVAGQPPTTIGRLKMVTPSAEDPIKRSEDGLFRPVNGEPLPNDVRARLEPGTVEGSNVNAVETMVGMIAVARQYEMQMKLLQNAESNDKTASQLLGGQG